jgi:penicillin-binding protein 2
MGFARSLELSCDTFYYQLGWELEDAYGAADGDSTERFQKYARAAGFGHPTGIDLPYEAAGRVPDEAWCDAVRKETDGALCRFGWLPGYTINMAIGQGDLVVTPLQMAVTYGAIANGGDVVRPHLAASFGRPDPDTGVEETIKTVEPEVVDHLGLSDADLAVIHEGLEGVVSGGEGTATAAFAGFPLDKYPLAGKTGTAQLGTTDLNDSWFVSYGPTTDPQYVIAVYLEKAGHGGESAAPIARQIWEGIFGLDNDTHVKLGVDRST